MKIEKAVIAIMVLIGIFIFLVSLVSMYNDFTQGRNLGYLLVDFAFLLFSAVLIGGGLKLYRKLVMFTVVTESAFEEVVYTNLRPLLREIAFSTTELDEVKTRVSGLEKKITHMEDELTRPIDHEARGAPADMLMFRKTTFYMRSMVVALFFFGTYLFLLDFNIPNEPYLYTLMYVYWWVFITKEFDLFSRIEPWVILGIPILLVPAGALILRTVAGVALLMGLIFITVVAYAYLYYQYARTLSVEESESERRESRSEREQVGEKERRGNFLYNKVVTSIRDLISWIKK
ncbi:MAG: hypothetical protein ACLFVI_05595 [Archaeoglobaceae archaeon]